MADDYLLYVLEQRVYLALKKIADQKKMINTLIHEKKELAQSLSMHKIEIDQLKRELTKAESKTDAAAVAQYQEKEAKLKSRLQDLLEKIDKVGILE